MIYSRCNDENPEGNLYCGRCGNTLVQGTVVGSEKWVRTGIPLMILGSMMLVLSFTLSLFFTCLFYNGLLSGDMSLMYPLMLLLSLCGPLGTGLVILGTAFYLRGRMFDGDGRGTATLLLMGGAVICLPGFIMGSVLSNSDLFMPMAIGNLQIGILGSAIAEFGMALFLIGFVLWLIRSRPGSHSRTGGT